MFKYSVIAGTGKYISLSRGGDYKQVQITYYVPCLNEKTSIEHTFLKLITISKELKISYEIIVFDDNSTDGTQKVIRNFVKNNKEINLRFFENSIRRGIGFNYMSAVFVSRGKYIMLVGADDSETISSLRTMLKILKSNFKNHNFNGVVPYFKNMDSRSFTRKLISKTFVFITRLISGLDFKYFNGPTIHLTDNIKRFAPSSSGFGFQAELLCKLSFLGAKFIEVQIDNNDRSQGKSNAFTLLNFLSVSHTLSQILFLRIRAKIWPINFITKE